MPPPRSVNLGDLTRRILERAVWSKQSLFPAHQPWADDFERLLGLAADHGVLEALFPRLIAREYEGVIAELRVAYFLSRLGFTLSSWQPVAVVGRPGDLEIVAPDGSHIFVEVKGPGWESELSAEEIDLGRQREPKFIDLEARAVDSIGPTLRAIDKALPKLSPDRSNVVAIAENLYISPVDLPREWLQAEVDRCLADPIRAAVSGVLLLAVDLPGPEVRYRSYFSEIHVRRDACPVASYRFSLPTTRPNIRLRPGHRA
jgi:hypothetical protein